MATIVDSYSESNCNWEFYLGDGSQMDFFYEVGQSFTGNGNCLDSIKVYIKKYGTPTGNLYAYIYNHTGTYGTSSLPTGTAIATSDAVNVASLTTSFALVEFVFSGENRIDLEKDTHYIFTISYPTASGISNFVIVGVDDSSPEHEGNLVLRSGSWVANSSDDMCFYVYGEDSTTPIIGKKYPLPPFRRSV